MIDEDEVWLKADPEDLWVMDKLIIARMCHHVSGPVGMDVPTPGWYIVRPCVNMIGLGLGAKMFWLTKSTDHLPIGHFWCEWFTGRHLSVDYRNGEQFLAVEGIRGETQDLTRWEKWIKVNDTVPLPGFLKNLSIKYGVINCEFIDGKLIEVHLRGNPNFEGRDITEFIPVWDSKKDLSSQGYRYIRYPGENNRIGAWIK
jgi:hypothetical protein